MMSAFQEQEDSSEPFYLIWPEEEQEQENIFDIQRSQSKRKKDRKAKQVYPLPIPERIGLQTSKKNKKLLKKLKVPIEPQTQVKFFLLSIKC